MTFMDYDWEDTSWVIDPDREAWELEYYADNGRKPTNYFAPLASQIIAPSVSSPVASYSRGEWGEVLFRFGGRGYPNHELKANCHCTLDDSSNVELSLRLPINSDAFKFFLNFVRSCHYTKRPEFHTYLSYKGQNIVLYGCVPVGYYTQEHDEIGTLVIVADGWKFEREPQLLFTSQKTEP